MLIVIFSMGGITILLSNIYFNTYYMISPEYLYRRTGPFNGEIEIKDIKTIGRYDSISEISSAIKPALGRNPLKISYQKYEDMPFSPVDEKDFIMELTLINSQIEINAFDHLELQDVL